MSLEKAVLMGGLFALWACPIGFKQSPCRVSPPQPKRTSMKRV